MTHDYEALRDENKVRYGTDIGRIGKRLLEDRYDKRTHFIFELLQNAEDALRRRSANGPRSVRFDLSPAELRVSHFGAPFDGEDVVGICGIDQSTKDLTAIGRFGIGFKSVYAFTTRPEVHSGEEDFAIESYVWPCAVSPIDRHADETVFVLPFEPDDPTAEADIAEGLRNLGPRTLLFLRDVEELGWKSGTEEGLYLRSPHEQLGDGVRKVTILGEENAKTVAESWLIFDREVSHGGKAVGFVEVAFKLSDEPDRPRVEAISSASLVAFFPTVLPTYTGFLVQGPYRTTPSRDNVPVDDPWNRHLVQQTTALLRNALLWMRDADMLDVSTIEALPLKRWSRDGYLFGPLFDSVIEAFEQYDLIPNSAGSYAAASNVRLVRGQEFRDLLSPNQLAQLLKVDEPIHWVSGDVTADKTPEVHEFLNRELNITEYRAESLLSRMSADFLENQTDRWIELLYKTLLGVPRRLLNLMTSVPIIRLEDGTHVVAFANGVACAFLPGPTQTAFPTIRRSLCASAEARQLFSLLGLTEPDPVDDVILNVLPRYAGPASSPAAYDADIERILRAFRTDSSAQRDKLISFLRGSFFVAAIDADTRQAAFVNPAQAYISTERLSKLFDGIQGVFLVDDRYDCLRGVDVRELLEASGATRYLAPVPVPNRLTESERAELRKNAGCERCTREVPGEDHTLRGMDAVLRRLPRMSYEEAAERSRLIWEGLGELLDRRGQAVFMATYKWVFYDVHSATTDADFIRTLNSKAWVPTTDGKLARPSEVDFQSLGWKPNPVLESKIHFKPPVVELLAREVGIDLAVLNLLKQHGLTDVAALIDRLQLTEDADAEEEGEDADSTEEQDSELDADDVSDGAKDSGASQIDADEEGDQEEASGESPSGQEAGGSSSGTTNAGGSGKDGHNAGSSKRQGAGSDGAGSGAGSSAGSGSSGTKSRAKASNSQSRFVSYVSVEPDEETADPDGLSAEQRLALEEKAIVLIIEREPLLGRTPPGNKGFDLVENDSAGEPERWVEVKAMKATLHDRPVGMSSTQFEFARKAGEQYWLYVVESADEPEEARIVKIQNPARRAGYFTFDHGWLAVAEIEPIQTASEVNA
jgi:hypothetical protein